MTPIKPGEIPKKPSGVRLSRIDDKFDELDDWTPPGLVNEPPVATVSRFAGTLIPSSGNPLTADQVATAIAASTVATEKISALESFVKTSQISDILKISEFSSANNLNQASFTLSPDRSEILIFARGGKASRLNVATKALTTATAYGTGDYLDPTFIIRPNGDWWVITSKNDDKIYHFTSTDEGATWSAGTVIHTQAESGHYEDFHSIQLENGDVLVTVEWEIVDKGSSEIHSIRYDNSGGSWGSRVDVLTTASTDFENPFIFIDPVTEKLTMLVAYVATSSVTYDQNKLYRLVSDDEGLTWGSPSVLLGDFSHVEYGGSVAGRRLLLRSTRGYAGDGFEPKSGYLSLSDLDNVADFSATWTSDDCAPFLVDNTLFLAPINGNSSKLFATRDVGTIIGNDIRIKARLKSDDATNPDIRVVFGYADKNNHYVLILNALAGGSGFWKRIGGTYTRLSSTGTYTVTDGQYYDVEIRWNKSTGAMSVYVDGTLFDSLTDTSLTAFESVGISSSELQTQQFITLDSIQVSDGAEVLWRDDFTGYPNITSIGPNTSSIAFLGGPVVFYDRVWFFLEDRDAGDIELYEGYFQP